MRRARVRPARLTVRRILVIGSVVHITYSNNEEKEYEIKENNGKKYYTDENGKINYI